MTEFVPLDHNRMQEDDFEWFKIKPGETKYVVFLRNAKSPTLFTDQFSYHYIGGRYLYCARSFGGQCPICDKKDKLLRAGLDPKSDTAKALYPNDARIAFVLDLSPCAADVLLASQLAYRGETDQVKAIMESISQKAAQGVLPVVRWQLSKRLARAIMKAPRAFASKTGMQIDAFHPLHSVVFKVEKENDGRSGKLNVEILSEKLTVDITPFGDVLPTYDSLYQRLQSQAERAAAQWEDTPKAVNSGREETELAAAVETWNASAADPAGNAETPSPQPSGPVSSNRPPCFGKDFRPQADRCVSCPLRLECVNMLAQSVQQASAPAQPTAEPVAAPPSASPQEADVMDEVDALVEEIEDEIGL